MKKTVILLFMAFFFHFDVAEAKEVLFTGVHEDGALKVMVRFVFDDENCLINNFMIRGHCGSEYAFIWNIEKIEVKPDKEFFYREGGNQIIGIVGPIKAFGKIKGFNLSFSKPCGKIELEWSALINDNKEVKNNR